MTVQQFFGASGEAVETQRKTPVDIVTYIASLASNPQEIDAILDDMRMVTAKLAPGQLPGAEDTKRIARVYFAIESYLIQKEPLKLFTKEAIRDKVAGKFELGGQSIDAYWQEVSAGSSTATAVKPPTPETLAKIKRIHQTGRGIVFGSLLIGIASFLLPVQESEEPFSNNFDMMFSVTATLLLFGAAWLFLQGLGGYKKRLKTVYRLLCAAMLFLAIAQSQQAIYTQLGLWSVPFIQQGGVALGFVPSAVLLYLSMWLFARLLTLKGFAVKAWGMLATGAAVALAAALIPLPSALPPEILRQVLPPSLLLAAVITFAALIGFALRRAAGQAYKPALAWLCLALANTAAIAVLYTVILIFLPPGNLFLAYGGISLLFIIAGMFTVRSAVAFNLIHED